MGKNTPNFTQADFENQFEFFGFSHGASTFGQNNESTRKVATQVAGALTIENNGNDEVYLGAEMGWSLYSIDPDTRKKELENAPELHWGKKHKMGAVWKVIPYGERSYFLHDALTQTFEDKYAEYANDFSVLIDENRSQHLDNAVRLGLLMRLLVSLASYTGIVTAIEHGWVGPHMPADFARMSFDFGYSNPSWKKIEDEVDPWELAHGMIQYNPANRQLTFRSHEHTSPEEKRQRARFYEFLAAKHGFFGDMYGRGMLRGSRKFLDTVACRTLRGMISSDREYAAGDIGDLFAGDSEQVAPATVPGAANRINTQFNLNALIGTMLAMQSNVGPDLFRLAVQAWQEVHKKNVVMALSSAIRGEKWEALLRLH